MPSCIPRVAKKVDGESLPPSLGSEGKGGKVRVAPAPAPAVVVLLAQAEVELMDVKSFIKMNLFYH